MAINGSSIAPGIRTTENILTWIAPAIAIPGLRYTQDNQHNRKELFVRDASTYTIGALTFFLFRYVARKGMDTFHLFRSNDTRYLTAYLIGLTANLLYAGIGAVKVSQAFNRYQNQKKQYQESSSSNRPLLKQEDRSQAVLPIVPAQFQPKPQPCYPIASSTPNTFFIPGVQGSSSVPALNSTHFSTEGKIQYLA